MNTEVSSQKNQSVFLWCVLGCFALIVFGYDMNNFIWKVVGFKDLVLYLSIFAFVLWKFPKNLFSSLNRLEIPFLLFLFYMFIRALFVMPSHFEPFNYIAQLFLLWCLVRVLSTQSISFFEKIFVWACGFMAVNALLLIFQHVTGQIEFLVLLLPIGHVSAVSDFHLMIMPFAAYYFLKQDDKLYKALFLISLVLGWGIFWMASTKSSLVGLALGLLGLFGALIILKSRRSFLLKHFKEILFLIFILLLTTVFLEWNGQTLREQTLFSRVQVYLSHDAASKSIEQSDQNIKSEVGTILARKQMYGATIEGAIEKVLWGWGPSQFQFEYPKYVRSDFVEKSILDTKRNAWMRHPHSQLLKVFFEGGAIGLVLVLLTIGFLFFKLFQESKKTTHAGLLLVALVSIFVSAQFSVATVFATNLLVLAFLLAYVLRVCSDDSVTVPKVKAVRQLFLIALLLVFSFYFAIGERAGSMLIRKAGREFSAGQKTSAQNLALQVYPKSYTVAFWHAYLNMRQGELETATRGYREVMRMYPNMVHAHENYFRILLKFGLVSEAKAVLEVIKKTAPAFDKIPVLDDMLKSAKP